MNKLLPTLALSAVAAVSLAACSTGEPAMKPSDAMSPAISGEAMMAEGCCISYDDYLSASSAHQGPVAFFFKASWCHICQQIDQDLTENPSRIPAGVTIVGVDYDANTELREKY